MVSLSETISGEMHDAEMEFNDQTGILRCYGSWTALHIDHLVAQLKKIEPQAAKIKKVDADGIDQLDSVGAMVLDEIIATCRKNGGECELQGLHHKFLSLLELIKSPAQQLKPIAFPQSEGNWLYRLGKIAVEKYTQSIDFIAFIGEVTAVTITSFIHPRKLRWRAICAAIDDAGYQALPILGLLAFLVGIVLAYQLGNELKLYGANIFIVDVTGIAMLREFGPLVAAIILAARTSTAFTSLIGAMKVNEELDALRTMGVAPLELLVIPRIAALLISFPLLIIWSSIFGILGAMLMAKVMLGITYHGFLVRFQSNVTVTDYFLGLSKAPIFALIITGVGCFQGFQVESAAESVGRQTTKAAVQSIFLIIVADAIYSVVFNWVGW